MRALNMWANWDGVARRFAMGFPTAKTAPRPELPGILRVAADGTMVRDAKRDGYYALCAIRDGDAPRALEYLEIGADASAVELVSGFRRHSPFASTITFGIPYKTVRTGVS